MKLKYVGNDPALVEAKNKEGKYVMTQVSKNDVFECEPGYGASLCDKFNTHKYEPKFIGPDESAADYAPNGKKWNPPEDSEEGKVDGEPEKTKMSEPSKTKVK